MQYPYTPGYYQAPMAPKRRFYKKFGFWWAVIAVVLAFSLGTLTGLAGKTQPGTVTTVVSAPTQATPDKTQPAEKAPKALTFGDGTWTIGDQMPAGTYRTVVPHDSTTCVWERLSGLDGSLADIITSGLQNADAHVTVTISKTDKGFMSLGCGNWIKK